MKAPYRDLGQMDYNVCWNLQQVLFDALLARKGTAGKTVENNAASPIAVKKDADEAKGKVQAGSYADKTATAGLDFALDTDDAGTILLVEHPPVYTLGKSGHTENLLIDREGLERLGATFYHIDRGGDITFHGPGQLVCYPILDLERLQIGLREYIEALEEAVIRTVAVYGIEAGRIPGASGVWIGDRKDTAGEIRNNARRDGTQPDHQGAQTNSTTGEFRRSTPRKICAIGVRSSRYITMHGFALNVSTDLKWFSRINPCGFTDKGVTSIERETGRTIPMDEVKALVVKFLGEILNVRIYK